MGTCERSERRFGLRGRRHRIGVMRNPFKGEAREVANAFLWQEGWTISRRTPEYIILTNDGTAYTLRIPIDREKHKKRV